MRADTPGYSTRRRIRLFVCRNLASVTPAVTASFFTPDVQNIRVSCL